MIFSFNHSLFNQAVYSDKLIENDVKEEAVVYIEGIFQYFSGVRKATRNSSASS
jgi:hypothetical protein